MFSVNGHPIMADDMDVLMELRNQLALQNIILLNKFKRSSANIQFCCPCLHNGHYERKPSCGILTQDINGKKAGTVHCFTCGYATNLEGLVSDCFGVQDNGEFGAQWLAKNFMTIAIENRSEIKLDFGRQPVQKQINYIPEEVLDTYRYTHPYAYKRKLTDEIIEKFDVGYDDHFELKDNFGKVQGVMKCLTFPVRDETGGTLFIARRSVDTKFFHYPDGVEKPVYGLYELEKDAKEVIVCESIINALTCWVYGKPAVALNGTGNDLQYKQLQNLSARKLIIALDPDEAGIKATQRLRNITKNKIVTEYVIPCNKDINDLSEEEFLGLEEIF